MNRTCRQCSAEFPIPQEDLDFYKSIAVKVDGKVFEMPAPTLCFSCRHQKRLSFRNEINLYHRKCDFSGKQIISMYSADKDCVVYDQHIWWSDDWDPLDYGRDFDFSRPFFDQFRELQLALGNKNSYLVFTADDNEDCAYGRFFDRNYKCFDCDFTYDSTECYECMDVEKGNRCFFSQKIINSSGLIFCYNMIGCHDCIASANLRNKRYCIFNQEYSKEEYEVRKAEMKLNTWSGLMDLKAAFDGFLKKQPRKYLELVNCEDCTGDYLRDCKNSKMCYMGFGLEDCKYTIHCWKAKNCYDWDFVAATGSTHCHEMVSSAYDMVNCHFCAKSWEGCGDMYYSELCLHVKNLFGCIGLRHKQYCILNKQYDSKEEYEAMMAHIIEHMIKTGEWGEFFPVDLGVFAYNETVAHEYFPLSREACVSKGLKWHDDDTEKLYKGPKVLIPDAIEEVDESICKEILQCEKTGRPYKIIPQELAFCKRVGLPVPRVMPRERGRMRLALRNPLALYNRNCDKCGEGIHSTYAPGRAEPVYCEKCYKEFVY